MPAAAVIPAPVAYIKAVAVKKLVVEFRNGACGPPRRGHCSILVPDGGVVGRVACVPTGVTLTGATGAYGPRAFGSRSYGSRRGVSMLLTARRTSSDRVTLKKLECSKQAFRAWILLHGIT